MVKLSGLDSTIVAVDTVANTLESNPKLDRRAFFRKSAQAAGLTALTGLAAIVESGCAILGPQVVYSPGAPSIISDWQDMYNAARQLRRSPHPGIDIEGAIGHPVLAPADGVVEFIHYDHVGGNVTRIYHGKNKEGKHIVTAYSHLHEVKVKEGQEVKRGKEIATIGMTGSSITPGYPHLHFILIEISRPDYLQLEMKDKFWAGWREDPKKYFPRIIDPKTQKENILFLCYEPDRVYKFDEITFTAPVKCGK